MTKNAKEDFVGQFVLSSSYTRVISTDSSDVHENIKYNQAHKVVLATSFSQILDCSFFLRCFLLPPGQRSIQSHSIPSVYLPQCYIHLWRVIWRENFHFHLCLDTTQEGRNSLQYFYQLSLELQIMNNPSIKKMVTRQDKRKVESRRAKEVRSRRKRENEREGEKMMLEWSMLKKMWKKKKENVSSMSSESQKRPRTYSGVNTVLWREGLKVD